mgnify:CR=1 FL=1|jgi:hypothetical protein
MNLRAKGNTAVAASPKNAPELRNIPIVHSGIFHPSFKKAVSRTPCGLKTESHNRELAIITGETDCFKNDFQPSRSF